MKKISPRMLLTIGYIRRILLISIVACGSLIASGALGSAQVAAAGTGAQVYTCPYHHFTVIIPPGWSTDTSFDTTNIGFCTAKGYTSPDFLSTDKHSALFYFSSWNEASGDAKDALRDEITLNQILHPPTTFSTVKTPFGPLASAFFISAAKSASHHLKNPYHWLLGSTCKQQDCTVFVGLLDTRVPAKAQAALLLTLNRTLNSFHLLPDPPPPPKITIAARFPIIRNDATGMTLTVQSAYTDTGNSADHLRSGTTYVVVHLALHNNGRLTLPYGVYNFELTSRSGAVQYPRARSTQHTHLLSSGTLTASGDASGDVLFAVPLTAGNLNFVWSPLDSSTIYSMPLN